MKVYELIPFVKERHHHIRISQITQAIVFRYVFRLPISIVFSGKALYYPIGLDDSATFCLSPDSAGSHDFGCHVYFARSSAHYPWLGQWSGQHIMRNLSILELVPVVLALLFSGLANKMFRSRVDKLALVQYMIEHTVLQVMPNNGTDTVFCALDLRQHSVQGGRSDPSREYVC